MSPQHSDRPRPSRRQSTERGSSRQAPSQRASTQRRTARPTSAQRVSDSRRQARRQPSQRPRAQRSSVKRPAGSREQSRRATQGTRRSSGQRRSDRRYSSLQRRRRTNWPVIIVLTVVLLAALGGGGWFLYGILTSFGVTVNGEEVTMRRGDTVQSLLDKGYVSPTPGNLLAIDGALLEVGEGTVCTVTVNGSEADVDTPLERDAVVEVGDGTDVTEDVVTTEEPIPFELAGGEANFADYWNASIHLLSDGRDGVLTRRTGKVSGKSEEEVTTEPIDAGFHILSADVGDDRVVALTFDDGPWPDTTEEILDVLEENGAKATFFTIGNQIADYADSVRRAHEMGCEVYTHTWDHASGSGQGVDLTLMSSEEQVSEVQRGFDAIESALGEEPAHIMRAPGGNFYGDLVTTLWPYVDAEIGWDVDTEDWARPGSDAIVSAILSVKPGQVILMHDGGGDRSQTVEALREALPQLAAQGYSFVTVSELLEYV